MTPQLVAVIAFLLFWPCVGSLLAWRDAKKLNELDQRAANLEANIIACEGDVEAQRREWRALQDEMREMEGESVGLAIGE